MSHAHVSHNAPRDWQFEREIAQFRLASAVAFRDSETPCQMALSTDGSSKLSVVFCQHRYPSPCRSVPTQNRPAYPFSGGFPDLATNRYMWLIALELAAYFVNLVTGNTKQKGNFTCLKNLGSSRRLQLLVLLAALKATVNARLLVRVSAVSQAKQSAMTTASKARLQVALLAHCLATSLAAKTTHNTTQFGRRRGLSLAAFSV